jgi:FemAB-related protein (PEP-CTERM system-associated)
LLQSNAERIEVRAPETNIAPAPTKVIDASDADRARWDAFVLGQRDATFFHRFGWRRVLERAWGHRTHYLLAERNGACVGVLPLAEVRSFLFGHSLISTPMCVYGGPVATDTAARDALIEAACRRAQALGVAYLELRNLTRMRPDWPCKDLYVTFRKPISASDDENMKAIPRKQRAMVRGGIKAGLTAHPDESVTRVYELYSESLRNLGTPVVSKRYFALLREEFGPDIEVLVIEGGGRPVAAVMSFRFRDEILPFYGGGSVAARDLNANDFMYWEVMRRAAASGITVFDYGRSKRDTGSYRFKTHWGFEPSPLYYEYFLVRAKAMPNLSPTNPKYQLFIEAWKRLPLGVSRIVGPWLARSLG